MGAARPEGHADPFALPQSKNVPGAHTTPSIRLSMPQGRRGAKVLPTKRRRRSGAQQGRLEVVLRRVIADPDAQQRSEEIAPWHRLAHGGIADAQLGPAPRGEIHLVALAFAGLLAREQGGASGQLVVIGLAGLDADAIADRLGGKVIAGHASS